MGPGTPPIIESFWHILSFSFLASRTTTSVYYISRQPFRSSSVHLGLFCINVHDSYPFRRLLHSYTTTSHSQAIDPFPRIAVFLLITVSKHCFFSSKLELSYRGDNSARFRCGAKSHLLRPPVPQCGRFPAIHHCCPFVSWDLTYYSLCHISVICGLFGCYQGW